MSSVVLDIKLAADIVGEKSSRTLFQMLRKTGEVFTRYRRNQSGQIRDRSLIPLDTAIRLVDEHTKSTHGNVRRHLPVWNRIYKQLVDYKNENKYE